MVNMNKSWWRSQKNWIQGEASLKCNSIICSGKQRWTEEEHDPLHPHIYPPRYKHGRINVLQREATVPGICNFHMHASMHARRHAHTYAHIPYDIIFHPPHFTKHMSGLTGPLVHNPIPFSLSAHSRLVISFNLADEKRQMFVLLSRGAVSERAVICSRL